MNRHNISPNHAIFGRYRKLKDTDVLQPGDETGCISTLLSGMENWIPVLPTWQDDIGKTITEVCDDADVDGWERVFRRLEIPTIASLPETTWD